MSVQVITVTKPGIVSWYGPTLNQSVPVGTKAVYRNIAPASAPYDLVVITRVVDGFNELGFWIFPNANIEDYISVDVVPQNPDGTFNPGDYSKLPKWLYTNGVVDKLGPGLIDPEWWAKNKWWLWLIGGVVALNYFSDNKK